MKHFDIVEKLRKCIADKNYDYSTCTMEIDCNDKHYISITFRDSNDKLETNDFKKIRMEFEHELYKIFPKSIGIKSEMKIDRRYNQTEYKFDPNMKISLLQYKCKSFDDLHINIVNKNECKSGTYFNIPLCRLISTEGEVDRNLILFIVSSFYDYYNKTLNIPTTNSNHLLKKIFQQ